MRVHRMLWKIAGKFVKQGLLSKLPQSIHRNLYTYPRFFVDSVEKVILPEENKTTYGRVISLPKTFWRSDSPRRVATGTSLVKNVPRILTASKFSSFTFSEKSSLRS